jgi:flagellar protein FlaF
MSLRAYQQAATRAEAPKDIEYRLFGQVTRALMTASEAPKTDFATRMDALDWNRRLWSTLALDCSSEDNQLAPQVRASIISLSLWVSRHSSAVMRGEDDFEALIDVNRIMMQALNQKTEGAAAA